MKTEISMAPLVLLLTDFQGLIPQRIYHFEGLDLEELRAGLAAHGLSSRVLGLEDPDLLKIAADHKPVAAVYATSQLPEYKRYVEAVVSNLDGLGVALFPALEHLLAHEDKLYQGLRLRRTDVTAPRSYPFGYLGHAYDFLAKATYPLVFKTPRGFGSSGVALVHSEAEGRKLARDHLPEKIYAGGRNIVRRAFERVRPRRGLGRILFQEFVPNCEGDWKILIWDDTACGLYRRNRPDDFRASGSGLIDFREVPSSVLDFAHAAMHALALPWGSFDILVQPTPQGDKLWLAEYQAIHFGLTTALKGKMFYERQPDGTWRHRTGRIAVERAMTDAIARRFPPRSASVASAAT
jgi:glutathione synthase/RimK-type ligase-like ATP-grasp enzyme